MGVLIGFRIGAIVLVGVLYVRMFSQGLGDYSKIGPNLAPIVDKPAPDLSFQNLSGKNVQIQDYLGKVVLVNFWATWCGPCVEELPHFQKYHKLYSPEFVVLAIDNQGTVDKVQSFINQLGLNFKISLDLDANVSVLYQTFGLPTSAIIDQEGMIRFQHIEITGEEQLQNYLTQLGVIE
jgi:thiol-disulfide isomerase/thioredoxin